MNDNEPGDMGLESTAGDAVQVRLAQRINAKPWVDVTYQLRASDNDTPEQDAARLARLRRMATAALDDIEALIAERGKLRAQPGQQRSTHPLVLRDGESVLPSLADLLAARGSGLRPRIKGLEALDGAKVVAVDEGPPLDEARCVEPEQDWPWGRPLLEPDVAIVTETPWGEEMALLEPLEIADLEAAPPAPIAPPSFPPDPVLLERVSCAVYWFCYRARDQEEACRTEGMISSWHRGMNRSGLFSCTARYRYDNATAAYAEVLAYWLEGFPGDAGAVLQCLVAGVVPFHLEDELRRFFAWIDHDPAKTAANKPYKASAMNLRLSLMQASLQVIQAKYEAACEEYGELWVVPSDEERQALRARAAKTWPPRKPKRVRRKNW